MAIRISGNHQGTGRDSSWSDTWDRAGERKASKAARDTLGKEMRSTVIEVSAHLQGLLQSQCH